MTKMYSCGWINGQYQKVGPPSQAVAHLSNEARRNQQTGTGSTFQYRTMSAAAQPPQNEYLKFHHSALSNRQGSIAQTSAVPHQTVSSQQPAKEQTRSGLAFTTRATSLPHEQAVYATTLMRGTGHSRQTAHKPHHQQNNIQQGLLPSIHPSYNNNVSKFFRQHSNTTNSSSSEHIVQQYSTQLNSTNNNLVEATYSANSKSYKGHKTSHFLSTAERDEQVLSSQIIASIANDLRNSFPAGSDAPPPPPYSSSSYRRHQFLKSNQNMQPVTQNVARNLSSNASQYLPLNSGQPSPQTTHSVMSRPQHSVDTPPQQSRNGGFAETVSSAAKSHGMCEALGMHSSFKESDDSIHSSPGRTGMRAVAVVQPLSQENYQNASNPTSSEAVCQSSECSTADDSLTNYEMLRCSPTVAKNNEPLYLNKASHLYSDKANHSTPNKPISHSGSAWPQAKQLCADDTGPEMVSAMHVDQHVAPTPQQSVTSGVPVSPHGAEKRSMVPTEAMVYELSSVPTVPLTTTALTKLIRHMEETARKKHPTSIDHAKLLLDIFWGGSCKKLASVLKTGWYKDLITDINVFCRKHAKQDSVILSHVKSAVMKQLKSYHVLKDDDVYSELPYKSPWLNVNKQLDDIDKQFGHPSSLKYRLDMSNSQSDHVQTDSICVQIATDVLNTVLPQTDVGTVGLSEEIHDSTVEAKSTASPNNTENVDPSDPCHSLKVKVLSQEEARVIFDQIQRKKSQSMDMDSQAENTVDLSTEVSDAIINTPNDPKPANTPVHPIEQVCCIARWMETILGSNTSSLSKCQCNNKQSDEECIDKNGDEEMMVVEQEEKLWGKGSDSKFHSVMEGEGQAKDRKDVGNPVIVHRWPKLCDEFGQSIALPEQENKSHFDEDTDVSHISMNACQSRIILLSDSDGLSNSGTGIQSDPEVECVQGQQKSTRITQACTSVSSDKEHENIPCCESEVASQMSGSGETSGQAQLPSTDGTESSQETKGETPTSETAAQTFHLSGKRETFLETSRNMKLNRKRPNSHDKLNSTLLKRSKKGKAPDDTDPQMVLEGVSKCRKVLSDVTDSECLASSRRIVELALFGSAQNKGFSSSSRKKCTESAFDLVQRPPKTLCVILSPVRTKSTETDRTGEESLKGRLYEKWRRSFPPTKRRRRRKLATQIAPLLRRNLKEAELSLHANKLSEMRTGNQNVKRCMSLKKRKSLYNGPKRGDEKMKKYEVVLKKPADQERSETEHGNDVCVPLQENVVLRFSVLPNSFTFKERSKSGEETNDPGPKKPDSGEGQGPRFDKRVMRRTGAWPNGPNPRKKHCPLGSPHVSKNPNVFLAFQKKYMEIKKKDE